MTMSNKSFSIKENPYMKDIQGGEKKVMKKILSVALSTAMAFSMFASVAFGADAEKLTPEQQFNVLKEAGIVDGFPDGLAHLDQTVTRAQLAKIIVKSLALEEVTGVATYKDKNYTAKHWAAPFIEAATKAGILEGVSTNPANPLFNPTGNVTVQELAKVLVVANKLEVPTEANNTASEWAKGYVAAAIKAGYIAEGINYQANATRAQTVVAAHAIYEFNNFKVTKAEAIDANNVKLTLSTGEVVEVKLEKALEANKATELTYKAKDGRELKYTVTYVVTAATKIESVTATNYKELTVKFDGDVEAKSAENTSNYTIAGITSFKSATLSADKKEVKLLIDENGGQLLAQKEMTLNVKGVKNANASKTFDEKVKFTAVDTQLPEVSEAKALGTKAVKVVFSEPVTKATASNLANYKIDGKAISGRVDFTYPNIAYILTDVSVGAHKLTVRDVADFNSFKVSAAEFDINVVEDTTAPEIVSVKSSDLTKVTVEFNEPVKSVKKAYQTSSTRTADKIEINDNKVTLTFSPTNRLSLGDTTVYLEGVTDYSNNSADRNVVVKPELDTTRPEVSSVTSEAKKDHTVITVEFSKNVDSTDIAKKDNYILRNEKGELVTSRGFDAKGNPILTPVYAKDSKLVSIQSKVELQSISKLPAGKYTLEVFGIRDQASIGNTLAPVKVEFNVTESDAIKPTSAWHKVDGNDTLVYVQFNKNVTTEGTGKADDINKYNYVAGNTYVPFPTSARAELYSANTVVITVPSKDIQENVNWGTPNATGEVVAEKIRVTNVADVNNNFLSEQFIKLATSNLSQVEVEKAETKATDRKTIKLKFNTPISVVDETDFEVVVNGVTYSNTNSSTAFRATLDNSNNNIVELTFTNDILPYDLAGVSVAIKANAKSADSYGRTIKQEIITNISDGINPELVADVPNQVYGVEANNGKVTLTFVEDVTAFNSAAAAKAFTVTLDNNVDVVVDEILPVSGNKKQVELVLKNANNSNAVVTAGTRVIVTYNAASNYIVDQSGNPVKSFTREASKVN